MADEYVRLDSSLQMMSAFWTPEDPENVSTGTLTIDPDGIRFVTSPQYGPATMLDPASFTRVQAANIRQALTGFGDQGLCTLCDVVERSRPGLNDFRSNKAISAIHYSATVCILGLHLNGLEDACLSSARYSFSGLSEWLPKGTTQEWAGDHIIQRIPLEDREVASVTLASGTRVSVHIFSKFIDSTLEGARVTRSIAYVQVHAVKQEALSWYLKLGNRLENLFSLLTGSSLALETLFINGHAGQGTVLDGRSREFAAFEASNCVWCTPDQLARCIGIWLGEDDAFEAVENVALGVARKGKLFLETQFLSLAQALEGLHRATAEKSSFNKSEYRRVRPMILATLQREACDAAFIKRVCDSLSHVQEVSFAERLAALLSRFSDELMEKMNIGPATFVSDLVKTRNAYTHAGENRPHKKAPLAGKELFLMIQAMRALLRGLLLLHLQIPEEQFSTLLVKHVTGWR